jgi:hypothetical protein
MAFGNVPGFDSQYKEAKPVRYSETMPSLYDEKSLSDLLSSKLNKRDHTDRIMEDFALTKSAEWVHEKEWRIVYWRSPTNADFEYVGFDARELKKIIFGCRMCPGKRNELKKITTALYPHVEFYEAGFKAGEFEMEMHRVV